MVALLPKLAPALPLTSMSAQGGGLTKHLGSNSVSPAMMGAQGGGQTSSLGASGGLPAMTGAHGGGLSSPLGSSGGLPGMTGGQSGAQASPLGSYNVDAGSVSVSGLSAGGFVAAQFGIAYSDVFKAGFGVFAGGPFDCARDQMYTTCMYNGHPSIDKPTANMKSWSGNQIAPTSNLESRKIYMWVGSADNTVGPNVMAQLKTQLANFDDAANTSYITTSGASHTFPTDADSSGNSECSMSMSPFVSNCGYDGAGAVLKWIYGNLNPRSSSSSTSGNSSGTTVSYSQTGTYGAAGMDTVGYLYLPKSCASGSSTVCKLHVVLHGCLQSYSQIGNKFITNAGYTAWADANDMIIMFPQAVVDETMHTVWTGMQLPNPNGCFDWVGWYGTNADQIGGPQMVAMVNAVKQIIGGSKASNTTG